MANAKKNRSRYLMSKPDYTVVNKKNPDHRAEFQRAMHYVQHEVQPKQLTKALILYAKNTELDYKLLNVLGDAWTAVAGKYSYIINQGGELPEDWQIGFDRLIGELTERATKIKAERKEVEKNVEKKNTGPVLTVQDRMRVQAEAVGSVFDEWLDDLMSGKAKKLDTMEPVTQMKLADFKAGQARWLRGFYEPELALVQEVLTGNDKQLVEGYSNVKKSCLLRVAKLLDKIITATGMIETVSKAQRKTRIKKMPSVAKQIANLKYCERHDKTGVASVSPAGIIGASEVWVYNTKYRKLGHYVAQDGSGLSIKGTTIKDFSTASVQKTLRKPKIQLKDFMGSGKVKLRKFLGNIKAVDTKLNGRINNNIVILKIVK